MGNFCVVHLLGDNRELGKATYSLSEKCCLGHMRCCCQTTAGSRVAPRGPASLLHLSPPPRGLLSWTLVAVVSHFNKAPAGLAPIVPSARQDMKGDTSVHITLACMEVRRAAAAVLSLAAVATFGCEAGVPEVTNALCSAGV